MTHARTISALFCLALGAFAFAPGAHADDPALKPGLDPGGTAVAILADGFDYTNAALAKVLARDGEGEAIAWDAVDQDHRPYAAEGLGTAAALAAAAEGGVRIVQVRVNTKDAASFARGIAFAVQTPARIVLAVLPEAGPADHGVLIAAARKFEKPLFIGSRAAGAAAPSEDIPNLLVIESGANDLAAAETVAHIIGCAERALEEKTGPELKRLFLHGREETPAPECKPKGAGETKKP